jgi:ComF family protein
MDGHVISRLLRVPGLAVLAALDDLVTTLYPTDCRACGGPIVSVGHAPVCDACIDGVAAQSMTLCGCCGEALDMEGVRYAGQFPVEGLLCSSCRMVPPEFERAVAYAVYQDQLREMVHLLKYEQMRSIAKPLGVLLARAIERLEGEVGKELLVVAVPLFPSKERERGYNQAILLADAALSELKKSRPGWKLQPAHGVIRRVKDTRSQFELTPKGRRRNLQGAFTVSTPAALTGREVLLVDDIYTTGATARACARVLRRAGAGKVWVATVSRAQREMVASWDASAETAVWDAGERFTGNV